MKLLLKMTGFLAVALYSFAASGGTSLGGGAAINSRMFLDTQKFLLGHEADDHVVLIPESGVDRTKEATLPDEVAVVADREFGNLRELIAHDDYLYLKAADGTVRYFAIQAGPTEGTIELFECPPPNRASAIVGSVAADSK